LFISSAKEKAAFEKREGISKALKMEPPPVFYQTSYRKRVLSPEGRELAGTRGRNPLGCLEPDFRMNYCNCIRVFSILIGKRKGASQSLRASSVVS